MLKEKTPNYLLTLKMTGKAKGGITSNKFNKNIIITTKIFYKIFLLLRKEAKIKDKNIWFKKEIQKKTNILKD